MDTVNVNSFSNHENIESKRLSSPQKHYAIKLTEKIILRPFTSIAKLTGKSFKLISYDAAKSVVIRARVGSSESQSFFKEQCIETIKCARNLIAIPSQIHRIVRDLKAAQTIAA